MKARTWKWILGFAIAAALIIAMFYFKVPATLQGLLKRALDWVARLGMLGPVLFAVIYILACLFFIPGSILGLGAGAVYGVVKGSILVSISSTLGATAACLAGRYLARDWVAKTIQGHATFSAMDKAVADEGWKIVLLTRLSPVFPFSWLNYAFGLTRVSLRDYVLASWVGMIPGTVMYVYIGSLAQAGAQQTKPWQWTLRGIGLLATIAVTVTLSRLARKALAKTFNQ